MNELISTAVESPIWKIAGLAVVILLALAVCGALRLYAATLDMRSLDQQFEDDNEREDSR